MPSDEIFDVVDEHDRVVSQERRSVVHQRGLRHRAVHILIFNRKGELFLQKRSMTKDVSPGCWDSSCCGHVDSGETYDIALLRELNEELGLKISPGEAKLLFKVGACPQTAQEFVMVYRLDHEGPFELHPEEIDTGEWFTTEQVDRLLEEKADQVAASFRYIRERYKNR